MSGSSAIVIQDDASDSVYEAGDKKRKRQDRAGGSGGKKFRARKNNVLKTVGFDFLVYALALHAKNQCMSQVFC